MNYGTNSININYKLVVIYTPKPMLSPPTLVRVANRTCDLTREGAVCDPLATTQRPITKEASEGRYQSMFHPIPLLLLIADRRALCLDVIQRSK